MQKFNKRLFEIWTTLLYAEKEGKIIPMIAENHSCNKIKNTCRMKHSTGGGGIKY